MVTQERYVAAVYIGQSPIGGGYRASCVMELHTQLAPEVAAQYRHALDAKYLAIDIREAYVWVMSHAVLTHREAQDLAAIFIEQLSQLTGLEFEVVVTRDSLFSDDRHLTNLVLRAPMAVYEPQIRVRTDWRFYLEQQERWRNSRIREQWWHRLYVWLAYKSRAARLRMFRRW